MRVALRAAWWRTRAKRCVGPALSAICVGTALSGFVFGTALSAQAVAEVSRWSGSAQGSGALLFGDTEQRSFGARGTVERADSVLELNAALQTLYGEASLDDGARRVIKRIWLGSLTADWRPKNPWSPFVLATVETNLEKRIASRYNAGVGVKYTARRTARTNVSLSVALLDERVTPDSLGAAPSRLTRWSTRFRLRHAFDDRTRFSHVVFWRPSATAIDRFVVQSNSELAVGLTRRTALTLSLLDNYDSEAVARGARTYYDGQLLLGLTATW